MAECRAARQASGGWFDPWAMPGGFDPTGLAKGWAVDRALDVLRRSGLAGAMVNGGGDLAAFGAPATGQRWRVGIRHPWCDRSLAGIIEVGAAVATSGSYERGAGPDQFALRYRPRLRGGRQRLGKHLFSRLSPGRDAAQHPCQGATDRGIQRARPVPGDARSLLFRGHDGAAGFLHRHRHRA